MEGGFRGKKNANCFIRVASDGSQSVMHRGFFFISSDQFVFSSWISVFIRRWIIFIPSFFFFLLFFFYVFVSFRFGGVEEDWIED